MDRSPSSLDRLCSYLERYRGLEGENGFRCQKGSFLTWVSEIPYGVKQFTDSYLPEYCHLHTIITSSRDVDAYENYMFLKSTYRELFKKYNFVGAVSPVEKVTGVISGWNLIKIRYLRNEI